MNKFWRLLFIVMLIFFIYHLIRDVSTDILGIHHPLVDVGHRYNTRLYWCSSYCWYSTFPSEVFNIVATAIVLRRNKIGILGKLVIISIPIWLLVWLSPFV